jgi:predicted oxidoreductase
VKSTRIQLAENAPNCSKTVAGLMRLNEWQMEKQELVSWIESCLELGITTFDHADIYGSYTVEEEFGRALSLTGRRDDVQLVTKCGIQLISEHRPKTKVKHYDTSANHILKSVERSLLHFNTDYIDLLLIHRPDPLMDADEVSRTLTDLVESGKVLAVGVSNFKPMQFNLLQSRMDVPLVTNQIQFSASHTEPMYDGTLDQCQIFGFSPMIWSPLDGGSIFNPFDDQSHRLHDEMTRIGEELGAPLDQVALAWLHMHPTRPLLVMGTHRTDRLKSAVEAENLKMDRQQWFRILQASHDHPVP